MMGAITDPQAATKVLTSWSREVELTLDGTAKYQCPTCAATVMVTAGKPDRVRCLKCKTLYMIEL